MIFMHFFDIFHYFWRKNDDFLKKTFKIPFNFVFFTKLKRILNVFFKKSSFLKKNIKICRFWRFFSEKKHQKSEFLMVFSKTIKNSHFWCFFSKTVIFEKTFKIGRFWTFFSKMTVLHIFFGFCGALVEKKMAFN